MTDAIGMMLVLDEPAGASTTDDADMSTILMTTVPVREERA